MLVAAAAAAAAVFAPPLNTTCSPNSQEPVLRKRPSEPFPTKEFVLAMLLSIAGLAFLPLGMYFVIGTGENKRGIPFLAIGPLVLLPG